jgi:peptidoglycan/LPS O-acetylase OafA/YrhL
VPVNLQARLDQRDNNFDVLRLFAAALVLWSHCYPLTGNQEPLTEVAGATGGEIGVIMFFAMSGFLIARSWSEDPNPGRYARKRALRLLPALAVAVAFTTFVVGPLFTTLPVGAYLTDPETWFYFVRASLLVTISGHLPGVFLDNVYPNAVNGSLWTLPVEAGCYVMIAVLGLLGIVRRSGLLLAGAVLCLLAITPLSPLASAIGDTAASGNLPIVLQLIGTFLLGALFYALRARLRLSWLVLAALALLWVLTWNGGWTATTTVLLFSYGTLVLAFRTPPGLRRVAAPGDVSYGVYVYAFPVQQSLWVLWGSGLRPGVMFAIAAPLTYLLALLSWRVIERPALRLKRRGQRPQVASAPVPAAAAPSRSGQSA